ncbi:hypothetical protein [Paenibacillus roseipurpureus]|uniref:Uncharacterized protein n=1 Tax=Paenibacillus roseopurpureus TaxID=2918901 RepID=A0AA96LQ07_9BACL|nr:hypothetical protein [Paenibacillus sp. MBLB1832]WNR45128.1 hypothetical protein MJB10_02965 [Paenibacillus sp. MBLB1832]
MIHKEIEAAIDEVIDNLPESEVFKTRFRKLIENALSKTQERSFRDDDLREILDLSFDEDEFDFEDEEGNEENAG